jgi:hypothetical protein
MVKAYRALLGFGVTFFITPLRAWLVWVDCDFFGDNGPTDLLGFVSQNRQLSKPGANVTCFGDASMTGLGVASFVLIGTWLVVLVFGSLAHVNDPKSWSIAARPHSWCDLLNVITAYPVIFLTIILNGRVGVLLGSYIFVTRGFLSAFTILLQPYYNFGYNDLRAGLFAGEAWAGIALVVVSSSSQPTSTAFTVASLVVYVFCAVGGWFLSGLSRRFAFNTVKQEYHELFRAASAVEAWRDGSQMSAHMSDQSFLAPSSSRRVLPGAELTMSKRGSLKSNEAVHVLQVRVRLCTRACMHACVRERTLTVRSSGRERRAAVPNLEHHR